MLNIIEGYDMKSLGYQSAECLHILLEAKKLAFADRDRYVSDPDFVDVPLEQLLSKEYAVQQRASINLQKAARGVAAGLEKDGGTMDLCVADGGGNVVSPIQRLCLVFCSPLVDGPPARIL